MNSSTFYIRATHPDGYRCGQWAKVTGVAMIESRPCYVVEFIDGLADQWPVYDSSDPYEFSLGAPTRPLPGPTLGDHFRELWEEYEVEFQDKARR